MSALAHPWVASLAALQVVGGLAVLGSYCWGLASHPETRADLWGGVHPAWQPLYTASMLAAAAGYFPFTAWILFRLDPDATRIGGLDYRVFHVLYALVLVPSALWLPLTFRMIGTPSTPLWWMIRLDLFLVAAGALGLLVAVLAAAPRPPGTVGFALAVAGLLAFNLQTTVLDAVVWPALFPRW